MMIVKHGTGTILPSQQPTTNKECMVVVLGSHEMATISLEAEAPPLCSSIILELGGMPHVTDLVAPHLIKGTKY
jgi:hypothetical protein